MKTINRNMLAYGTVEEITIYPSELTRKLDNLGAQDNAIMKICADVPKNKNVAEEEIRVRSELINFLDKGYNNGGLNYRCVMLTASDGRKATSTWLLDKYVKEVGTWMYCGLDPKDVTLAVNKFMAYLGLLASASKRFEDVFGRKIDIRRVAVIPDYYVDIEGNVDFATMEGVEHNVNRTCHINAFDGFAIINAKITKGKTNTLRIPWGKIMAQATSWSELKKFAKDNGVEPKFKDYWGNEHHIDDVDVVITESCFKAVKLYKSWEQYCKAFEELGHNVCVCVQEHAPKLKGMPYQQGQTLMGTSADAQWFADHTKRIMDKYQNPEEAAMLLTKWQRRVAKVYPALLKEMHTARSIQEKYSSKRQDAMGGRIPELGYNAFLAPDPVAFAQHLFGLEVTGYLKAEECYCTNCEVGEVDVTRNPHLDNAHVILNNVESCPLAMGPTMFINIMDLTTIKLRADYDGDHVWYSQHPMLLSLVHRTYNKLNNLPVDWDAPSAKKVHITKGAIADFVSNLLHGSEIGLYADTLTKMWNKGYDRDTCAWLTYAGNVLIDAAKHGSIKIEQPVAVQMLSQESLANFAMYAKADDSRPIGDYWTKERITNSGKILPPRCAYTGSFLDMYSKDVSEQIPEELEINGLEELIFNPAVMQIRSDRKFRRADGSNPLAMLCKKATIYNKETGKFEDGGLFQQIAFRHAAEWNKIHNAAEFKMNHDEWEEAKRQEALKEIIAFVREAYAWAPTVAEMSDDKILEVAYDYITWNVFNTTKVAEGYDTAMKSAYWRIFGKMAYNTVCHNLEEEALEFDPTIDDDDEDLI